MSTTAQDLIDMLSKFPPDTEVMILDGFNGGGYPRTINLGTRGLGHTITDTDAEHCGDCEDKVGQKVLILGYGCY